MDMHGRRSSPRLSPLLTCTAHLARRHTTALSDRPARSTRVRSTHTVPSKNLHSFGQLTKSTCAIFMPRARLIVVKFLNACSLLFLLSDFALCIGNTAMPVLHRMLALITLHGGGPAPRMRHCVSVLRMFAHKVLQVSCRIATMQAVAPPQLACPYSSFSFISQGQRHMASRVADRCIQFVGRVPILQ